jgi:peptidoglycan/xylan/chitin deacetylase (PgdA/CDA1 family)
MARCIILNYHIIDQPRSALEAPFCCPPSKFDDQLRHLHEWGIEVLPFPQLLACMDGMRPWPENAVVITFDDGVRCVYEHALPILARYGFPASVFVVSGLLDADNDWLISEGWPRRPMLRRSELVQLARAGFDIGSHTVTHRRLGKAPAHAILAEIRDSKAQLEDVLSTPVAHFAYPYGSFNRLARDAVEAVGYVAACSTIAGRNAADTDRFLLRRATIYGNESLLTFKHKVSLGSSLYAGTKAMVRDALTAAGLMRHKCHA